MRVWTRGNRATVNVLCGNETHKVRLTADGSITTEHDAIVDQVISALGGTPHSCMKVVYAFNAAQAALDALTGKQDFKNVYFVANHNWKSTTPNVGCAACTRYSYQNLSHFATPEHLANEYNTDKYLVSRLLTWLMRNTTENIWNERTSRIYIDNLCQNADIETNQRHSLVAISSRNIITPTFISHAKNLVGNNVETILYLRNNGVKVEWLSELDSLVSYRRKQYAQENSRNLARSLASARNVPTSKVAYYMNNGVLSHYYTYAQVNATIQQILTVYNRTNRTRTLADFLQEGISIPEALRIVGEV